VPAAAPLPRSPSVLTTYSAADLLTAPGCPVCRYAGEASDRYLSWFALEAHADATTLTRLTGSPGACARHTRRLMGQPGAAVRLTAVYGYIVPAARDRLAGRVAPLAACPMCEHDDAAARRALDMLLEGLSDPSVRDRCRELGGLCVPHLNAAVAAGHRRVVVWLTETMMATLSASLPASSGWLGTWTVTRMCAPYWAEGCLSALSPARTCAQPAWLGRGPSRTAWTAWHVSAAQAVRGIPGFCAPLISETPPCSRGGAGDWRRCLRGRLTALSPRGPGARRPLSRSAGATLPPGAGSHAGDRPARRTAPSAEP
jgi:hypothetical protein